MGWHEHYRREAALDSVVDSGELTVPPGFDGPDEVLLALHHRWSLRLTGRVELAVVEAERDPGADGADLVDAVGDAWRQTAANDTALRRLLDEHADHPALRAVTRAEQRMLAGAAGLTDPDPGADADADEQAAVGAAFVALLRTGTRPARRVNPVERLLRRLAPSA